ncbi:MAG: mechanosensitive ion channel family protein [Chloroflexi bacterium]|nr:MAG: mechanosensitive ion channel family protein [Chloroflexota bacterium]
MTGIDTAVAWLAEHGFRILLVLLLALVGQRTLGWITRLLKQRIQQLDEAEDTELDRRTETFFGVIRNAGMVLIWGTAVLIILNEVGISIMPILASVGVAGLAVGLGAQTLVKDVISGIFILIENQYTVGDVVEIAGLVGKVEEMTLRTTELRDARGVLHIIPNGEIRIVSNHTREWSRAIVDVGVSYNTDITAALKTLTEIGENARQSPEIGQLILETPQVTGVEELGDWSVRLRIMVKTQPNQQHTVRRYLLRQIQDVFTEKGIELAFPRQDIMLLNVTNTTSKV